MKVIKEYGINNKRDEYNISEAPGANMQNMVGQRIEVKAYRVTEDTDATTGEIKKLLKVIDTDSNVCGTGSKPYIEGFLKYLEFSGEDDVKSIGIGQKHSKAGRPYLLFIA